MRIIRICTSKDEVLFIPEDKILLVKEKDLAKIIIELVNGKNLNFVISPDLEFFTVDIYGETPNRGQIGDSKGKNRGMADVVINLFNEWKENFKNNRG